MTNPMMEAFRLTREGRLGEATDMIQAMLAGGIDPKPEALLAPDEPAPPPPEPELDHAGQFVDRVHDAGRGTLRYKLYRPADLDGPAPLVVMLHGCTQSATDFAAGTGMNALADRERFLVAYPMQSRSANPQGCWNWFRPADQARDRGEPALIAGITRDLIRAEPVDPARVYIAGLSAGGAAAAIMAQAYPDLYAAVGVHSGLACGAAHDLASALSAMQRGSAGRSGGDARFVPTIIFHGDADRTVDPANADELLTRALAASPVPLVTREESAGGEGGRGYTRLVARDGEGRVRVERWMVRGAGHAWSGGDRAGSYTDPTGPDASRMMLRFFLEQRL